MNYFTRVGESEFEYRFEALGDDLIVHGGGGEQLHCSRSRIGDGAVFSLIVDGRSYDCLVEFDPNDRSKASVQVLGDLVEVFVTDDRERAASQIAAAKLGRAETVCAAMPGVVVAVDVAVGEVVQARQTLVILDAMKMQNPIQASGEGVVDVVHVAVGDTVTAGQPLIELRPPEPESGD